MRFTLLFLCLGSAAFAQAHTVSPFIMPDSFVIKDAQTGIQSGITVEKFYVPSRNFKTSYQVTLPNGQQRMVEPAAALKKVSVAEFDTPVEGTYRIRTVNATGNESKYVKVDGRWLRVRPNRPANMSIARQPGQGEPRRENREATPASQAINPAASQPPRMITEDKVPAGAPVMLVKSIPVAETFISKGKPTPVAAPAKQGFELVLSTHPNEIFAGDTIKGQVMVDGKPIPNLEVEVFKGANAYDHDAKRDMPHIKTDAQGFFSTTLPTAGVYLITTAYPGNNPDATQKPADKTYQYGLTLEVGD